MVLWLSSASMMHEGQIKTDAEQVRRLVA